jgi:palmitoyl-protein thioesterase
MVLFTEDQTVVPKESSWFGSESPPSDSSIGQTVLSRLSRRDMIPLRLHPIYTEDWIGLRQLDEDGRLIFEACNGKHMHMGECWEQIVEEYCGGVLKRDF